MSSFHLSDFTVAGAYASAVVAASKSDRRSAELLTGPSDALNRPKDYADMVRRIVTAVFKRRSTALRLASPQA